LTPLITISVYFLSSGEAVSRVATKAFHVLSKDLYICKILQRRKEKLNNPLSSFTTVNRIMVSSTKDAKVNLGLAESVVSFSSCSEEDAVQQAQDYLKKFARVKLAHLPTPLEYCSNLSKELGVNIYIKRDDCTGLATGGNKARKLGTLFVILQWQLSYIFLSHFD
jgi:hypothetical protein